MLDVAARELRSLFLSPLAWAVLGVTQAVLGYAFLVQMELFLQWQPHLPNLPGAPGMTAIVVAPLFKTAGMVLLLITPLITMRLVSEERRSGTLALLMSSPVSATAIVLGKFLGVTGFFAVLIGVIVWMPLSLLAGGTLDFGLLAACLLAIVLLVMSFSAAGLFLSTVSEQPTVAAISTFGLLLLLWILDWAGSGGGEGARGLLGYLSLTSHIDAMLRGVIDSADVAYYVLFIVTFLVLAVRRLDTMRLGY